MVQGFIKLYGEDIVIIRCLQRDLSICQGVVREAVQEYSDLLKHEMNKDIKLLAEIDSTRFLIERQLVDNSSVSLATYDIALG